MHDEELTKAICEAADKAFKDLFSTHPGTYYYCTLVTTGEAHCPVVSGWSKEALAKEVARTGYAEAMLKWNFVESPYYAFGYDEAYFAAVREMFEARHVTPDCPDKDWWVEYDVRMDSMVQAMKLLDQTGLFGLGSKRDQIVVLVECMPPDQSNTVRAKLLNSERSLAVWLNEAAE